MTSATVEYTYALPLCRIPPISHIRAAFRLKILMEKRPSLSRRCSDTISSISSLTMSDDDDQMSAHDPITPPREEVKLEDPEEYDFDDDDLFGDPLTSDLEVAARAPTAASLKLYSSILSMPISVKGRHPGARYFVDKSKHVVTISTVLQIAAAEYQRLGPYFSCSSTNNSSTVRVHY